MIHDKRKLNVKFREALKSDMEEEKDKFREALKSDMEEETNGTPYILGLFYRRISIFLMGRARILSILLFLLVLSSFGPILYQFI